MDDPRYLRPETDEPDTVRLIDAVWWMGWGHAVTGLSKLVSDPSGSYDNGYHAGSEYRRDKIDG